MMKALYLLVALMLPMSCFAAGQTKEQFNNTIDLGAGYSVPVSPSGETKLTLAEASIGADLPNGLDCSGIDWKMQFRNSLSSGLSMTDVKDLGAASVAASLSYLTAALRPTQYEALQNALKNASKKIQVAKNECRTIEASLVRSDPLGLYEQRQKAANIQASAASGQTWEAAVAGGVDSNSKWSLASTVANSQVSPTSKLTMNAMLGDVVYEKAGGKSSIKSQAPASHRLETAYKLALKDVSSEVFKRFTTGVDCGKPLFSDPDSQAAIDAFGIEMEKAIANKKPSEFAVYDRDEALVFSVKQSLSRSNLNSLSCGSVEAWKDFLPTDRAAVVQIVASQATIRGIALSIRETDVGLGNLKTISPDDKQMIDDMSPLPQLKSSFGDLKASIDEQNKTAMALLRANLHAQQERSQQAAERLKLQQQYKPAPKYPSLFGGQ